MAEGSGMIKNPIRAVAVACVAVTSAYIMYMGYRLNEVLSGPGWCSTAIGAGRADANTNVDIGKSCVGLLTIQLKSIATNSHILFGVIALCLLTLIVIVIAGGKLDASGFGAHIGLGKTDAAKAANATASAAQDKADEISAEAAPGENG